MQPKTHTIAANLGVQELVPQGSGQIALTPDREVLCVHRGDEPYEDMFDGRPYKIAPGFFRTQYGAAVHFKERAVVPGTRNPETRYQASFIAIIGVVELRPDSTFTVLKAVDDPAEWTPFTAEERGEYKDAVEALDRDGMVNPIDAEVMIMSTNKVRQGQKPSRLKGGAGANAAAAVRSRGRATRVEVTDPSILQPIPAEENEVVREAQRDARQAAAEGHKVD